jgi:uncharacterized membrane protein YGL010W
MKSLAEQLALYASHHTKPLTRMTHVLGVPLAVFSAMIFLGWFHLVIPNLLHITFLWLGLLILVIYYLYLDVIFGLIMLPILFILAATADVISQPIVTWHGFKIFLWLFGIGWALQLLGHLIEGKKPALLDNFSQAVIAPLFLLAELCFMFEWRLELKKRIDTFEHTKPIT